MNIVLQLILILAALVLFAVVGYVVYDIVTQVQRAATDKLQSSSISLSTTGAKIGVKGKSRDRYLADTQSLVYRGWTTGETRGYRSWLWGSSASSPAADQGSTASSGGGASKEGSGSGDSSAPLKDLSNDSGKQRSASLSHTRSAPP